MNRIASFALIAFLSSCASGSGVVPPAAPFVAPKPTVPVVQAPPQPNLATNWQDWPMAAGDWSYRRDGRGSSAVFGRSDGGSLFVMRCDKARQKLVLARSGAFPDGVAGRMSIRTSSALQTYPIENSRDFPNHVSAELMVRDPQLDAMVFSRGKFIVSVKGASDLVIPAWAEVARIVEDCRE